MLIEHVSENSYTLTLAEDDPADLKAMFDPSAVGTTLYLEGRLNNRGNEPLVFHIDAIEGRTMKAMRLDLDDVLKHLIREQQTGDALLRYYIKMFNIISEALGHPYADDETKTVGDLAVLAATTIHDARAAQKAADKVMERPPSKPIPCEYCDAIEADTGVRHCPIHT